MSARIILKSVRETVDKLGRNSVLPDAFELSQRAIVALDELKEIMFEFLIECPRCNGARGFFVKGLKDGPAYQPCSTCDGFGVLPRKGSGEFKPQEKGR